jgi:hypothetical protein
LSLSRLFFQFINGLAFALATRLNAKTAINAVITIALVLFILIHIFSSNIFIFVDNKSVSGLLFN